MKKNATFSKCRRYRYALERDFERKGATVGFLLHNPSSADESAEDRTSMRGISFADSWNAGRLIFINVWAGIATRPSELWSLDDPVGPENDQSIADALDQIEAANGFLVAAWGCSRAPKSVRANVFSRLTSIESMLKRRKVRVGALSINKDGSPKHPLYVPNKANLVDYIKN